MAMVAPQGVTAREIIKSYVAQRRDRLAAEPYVTGRSRHDEQWIMVLILAPEPDGTIETTVMHVFADQGERARASIYVERKVHDATESDEPRKLISFHLAGACIADLLALADARHGEGS